MPNQSTKFVTQLASIRSWFLSRDPNRHLSLKPALEITLIIVWAIWLGRDYVDFSVNVWPNGREFGMAIQPHYIWTQLQECGTCMLWNGYYNGGAPAFAELHAAILHPLVIVFTLIWGGINGAKMVLIGSLAMAGIAQYWLARVMKLGWVARLWSGGMAVAGGHLASRMEIGVIGIIISTAACSLIIAPGIKLALSGKRRDAVPFAITLALAIVAGQGYLQIGLFVSIIPAFVILLFNEQLQLRPVWKEFLLAGGLALMLAAPFILPVLLFWPEFGKAVDPAFGSVQPLEYIPLNFVIRDRDIYYREVLGKLPYPYLYMNFIGWTPVLLALLPFRLAKLSQRRLVAFFGVAIGLILLASSAITFKQLGKFVPDFAAGIRNPSLIAGLAVPLILGLAAWGVDWAVQSDWIIRLFSRTARLTYPRLLKSLSWIFVCMILLASLRSVYEFSREWLFTVPLKDGVIEVVLETKTEEAAWVALPFGELHWGPPAAEAGVKMTEHARPSHWKERRLPPPYLKATRAGINDVGGEYLGTQEGVNLFKYGQNFYAQVVENSGEVVQPCTAVSQGGHIDVTCQTTVSGRLIVQENWWMGWFVWRDGVRIEMDDDNEWLNAPAPAGEHHYQFRYYPWEVAVGCVIMVVGLFLLIAIWRKNPNS